ncbi:Unknown protein sequence [Pseudomonas syringae pv. aptata]|nr:Unknown protein sequence [Pseudomonas syringae pv. aptata]
MEKAMCVFGIIGVLTNKLQMKTISQNEHVIFKAVGDTKDFYLRWKKGELEVSLYNFSSCELQQFYEASVQCAKYDRFVQLFVLSPSKKEYQWGSEFFLLKSLNNDFDRAFVIIPDEQDSLEIHEFNALAQSGYTDVIIKGQRVSILRAYKYWSENVEGKNYKKHSQSFEDFMTKTKKFSSLE